MTASPRVSSAMKMPTLDDLFADAQASMRTPTPHDDDAEPAADAMITAYHAGRRPGQAC